MGLCCGTWGGQSDASSHPCDVIPGRNTGFPSCCKVAENPEGITSTALVRVDPVLSCWEGAGGVRPCYSHLPLPQSPPGQSTHLQFPSLLVPMAHLQCPFPQQ